MKALFLCLALLPALAYAQPAEGLSAEGLSIAAYAPCRATLRGVYGGTLTLHLVYASGKRVAVFKTSRLWAQAVEARFFAGGKPEALEAELIRDGETLRARFELPWTGVLDADRAFLESLGFPWLGFPFPGRPGTLYLDGSRPAESLEREAGSALRTGLPPAAWLALAWLPACVLAAALAKRRGKPVAIWVAFLSAFVLAIVLLPKPKATLFAIAIPPEGSRATMSPSVREEPGLRAVFWSAADQAPGLAFLSLRSPLADADAFDAFAAFRLVRFRRTPTVVLSEDGRYRMEAAAQLSAWSLP